MADKLLDFYAPILRDIKNIRYSELSSSTIIVFDYLLTLDREIQYIWKARWTIGKVLFFLNRYYTLFVVAFNNYALFSPSLTDDVSLHWFRWQGWTGLISAALAEITLQLRLYALYYGSKKVLSLMASFFIAAMVASAVIMGTTLSGVTAISTLLPGMKFCVPLNVSGHFYAFWIPILAFETLLCALACARGFKSYKDREIRTISDFRRRRRGSRATETKPRPLNILEILLRDSVFYFIIIFATYLTTTMIWIFGRITVIEIPVGFTVALSSVIANRLLLNLRGSRDGSSANPHPNMSSQSNNAVSYTHTLSLVGVTTTVEDGRGREVGGYELEVLRNLKVASR